MLFIVDLDDTLLRKDGTVSDYTVRIVQRAQKEGHLFVFNSARSYARMQDYVRRLHPDYVIANGGSEIYHQGACVYQNLIPTEILHPILKEVQSHPEYKNCSIQTPDQLYTMDLEYAQKMSWASYKDFKTTDFPEPASKLLVEFKDKEALMNILQSYPVEVVSYFNGPWYRISMTTKAKGNQALFELLKLKDPIDYCFGDDYGDVEMLQAARYGVMMKQAQEDLLQLIPLHTKYSNQEDGVAKMIEEILDQKD